MCFTCVVPSYTKIKYNLSCSLSKQTKTNVETQKLWKYIEALEYILVGARPYNVYNNNNKWNTNASWCNLFSIQTYVFDICIEWESMFGW